ncbi:YDG_SRA [Nesidiocoris tenuis]|nr:YDG_SRA [Nesidiocoris tenuis]
MVQEAFGVAVDRQRLIYMGKLIPGNGTLFEHGVKNETVVVLCPKMDVVPITSDSPVETDGGNKDTIASDAAAEIPWTCQYYEVGDIVDVIDARSRGWHEGRINEIVKCEDEVYYKVSFLANSIEAPLMVTKTDIRPVARETIDPENVKPSDVVMINYNREEPNNRGHWYDLHVETVEKSVKTQQWEIRGSIRTGNEIFADKVLVPFIDEIMKITTAKLISDRSADENREMKIPPTKTRKTAPFCSKCKDNIRRKCKECGCNECGGKEDPDQQICCDQCEYCYHMGCLDPPLLNIPENEWYCPSCKTDTTEISVTSQKRQVRIPQSSRDWGKGMACVGRSQVCEIVDKQHFGPIPGVDVGTMWRYRIQCSESGVHRPPVSGIHGKANIGAFSIVFAGGYEADDRGDEFVYTGAGGRDLSGNKRTNKQSCDQTLTRENRALALNCAAKFNENGAEAKNWQEGKPVRVVRSYKLRKQSQFAPAEGLRYDGVYKVVKYYQAKGESGFLEWRYLMRRDDESPAPWTKAGKARIEALGLSMPPPKDENDNRKEMKRKRQSETVDEPETKKKCFRPEQEVVDAINMDTINDNVWEELMSTMPDKPSFLEAVKKKFTCAICMDLVRDPLTVECGHTFCYSCVNRLFDCLEEDGVPQCPNCRHSLMAIAMMEARKSAKNRNLKNIISTLFAGYE